MQFDDDFGPAFPALAQPVSEPLAQPTSAPSTLFGGAGSAVQFGQVTPIHFGTVMALHGPDFEPVYESGVVHAAFHFAPAHAIVGTHVDLRG